MKIIVRENTWINRGVVNAGWGNGYVLISEEHPLYGKGYDEIHELMPELSVHGGLTFADDSERLKENWTELAKELHGDNKKYWIVGFDTVHYGDNLINCSREYVLKETENLAKQLENYEIL